MRAEIISIGSELVHGKGLDTNAHWLSGKLSALGIEVAFHTTVGDDLADNEDVFRCALARTDLVIATGGLGPTQDDLTREALAKLAGVELVLDESSLEFIETLFKSRFRDMPERNRMQALFPAGATPIPNPNGTAPGIWMELDDKPIVAMPGVPSEMTAMFEGWVVPRLKDRYRLGRVIVHKTLRCFGAGESHIESRLGDLTRRGRHPEVGITASAATISLRITATAETIDEANEAIARDEAFIRDTLGDLVFGTDEDELQTVLARLLAEKGQTLATAESCTGGLIGHWLTEVPGVSASYLGGVIAYSNDAKQSFLDVPAELLAEHGAVSAQVAERMAAGCRARFGADIAVAVTGIAGPSGGTPEKPVGLVYVSIAHAAGGRTVKFVWGANRSLTKICTAKMALNLARLHLLRQ